MVPSAHSTLRNGRSGRAKKVFFVSEPVVNIARANRIWLRIIFSLFTSVSPVVSYPSQQGRVCIRDPVGWS